MLRLGFDVGGTSIKLGLVEGERNNPKLIKLISRDFPKNDSPLILINQMAEMADEMLSAVSSYFSCSYIKGIGIAVAGSIDEEKGAVIHAHNLGLHDFPLVKNLQLHYPHVDIRMANDADAAAIGELTAGALRGVQTGIMLTLGTGVGGGIILNGKLFKGGLGHGVELGHMTLMQGGPLCSCGNRGCIEAFCSATALIKAGEKAGLKSSEHSGSEKGLTAKDVIDLAKSGDVKAKTVFDDYLDYLSSALASIAALLDPEIFVIGGGVAEAGDFLFEPLKDMVEKKSFFKYRYKIVPACFGKDAGVVGAACLIGE